MSSTRPSRLTARRSPGSPAAPGLALIAGGIPVIAHEQVAGAIGVAGAMTGAQDRRIAETAVQRALPQAGRR